MSSERPGGLASLPDGHPDHTPRLTPLCIHCQYLPSLGRFLAAFSRLAGAEARLMQFRGQVAALRMASRARTGNIPAWSWLRIGHPRSNIAYQ